MIEKVISGGQIGADIAGLRAARALDVETGGFAAAGFMTLLGPNLDLRDVYGLTDTGKGYGFRTDRNVEASDATIRFAYNFNSPGERRTLSAITRYSKPYIDVTLERDIDDLTKWVADHPAPVLGWLGERGVNVLNVAGNGSTEVEAFVEGYMTWILERGSR